MPLNKAYEKHLQLNEAYEEVDEQKRDVASWKKKTQKANSEQMLLMMLMMTIIDDDAVDFDNNEETSKGQW